MLSKHVQSYEHQIMETGDNNCTIKIKHVIHNWLRNDGQMTEKRTAGAWN